MFLFGVVTIAIGMAQARLRAQRLITVNRAVVETPLVGAVAAGACACEQTGGNEQVFRIDQRGVDFYRSYLLLTIDRDLHQAAAAWK